jgi:hypothetical protein
LPRILAQPAQMAVRINHQHTIAWRVGQIDDVLVDTSIPQVVVPQQVSTGVVERIAKPRDLGVDRDHLVAVRVRRARSPFVGARLAQLRRDLVHRVGQVPSVDGVGFADHGLFSGGSSSRYADASGFIPRAESEREVALDRVGPNFFHAIGARLIRGRDIEPRDLETVPPAAVINEVMTKRCSVLAIHSGVR